VIIYGPTTPVGNLGIGATNAPCNCVGLFADPETETLRVMITNGWGQWEASRALWGPDAPAVEPEVTKAWVWAEFLRAFTWLRLPEVLR